MKENFNYQINLLGILSLLLITIILYSWTIFEPFAGDALLHLMDDTQIHSISDILKVFYNSSNELYVEDYRLNVFHRPVFNELYISAIKNIFGSNIIWFRIINVLILGLSSILLYKILLKLTCDYKSSFLGAIFLLCSPSLFFGIYEFGLSFSGLLVFLSLISIYFLQAYLLSENKYYILLTLFFTFLTVFTKESAMFFPFSMIILFIFFYIQKHHSEISEYKNTIVKISKKNFLFFALFIFISLLYLYTRYLKLGSIFSIVAVEQEASLFDSIIKLFGYVLHLLYIPTNVLPNYMIVSIFELSYFEIGVRVILFIFFIFFIYNMIKKNLIGFILLLLTALALFVPIIKASRNAPYYSDMMVVPFSILVGLGFYYFSSQLKTFYIKIVFLILITLLIISSIFFQEKYINNPGLWLAKLQGVSRAALSDFSTFRQYDTLKYFGTSGMLDNGIYWILSQHSGEKYFGSIFSKNFNMQIQDFVRSSDNIKQEKGIAFLDFIDSNMPRKVSSSLPGFGRLLFTKFDNGFIKEKVDNSTLSYNIINSKVIRIVCKNKVLDKTTFNLIANNNSILTREINLFNNISKEQNISFFEFVTNNEYQLLEFNDNFDDICKGKEIFIYKDLIINSMNNVK